jgi:hypothetical protein
MARVANSWLFRAEAMRLDWSRVLDSMQIPGIPNPDGQNIDALRARVARRSQDVHVWWACSRTLGVPRGPFTVWTRPARDVLRKAKTSVTGQSDGTWITWGGIEAAAVEVTFTQVDPTAPSAVFGYRTGGSLWDAVGAVTAPAGSAPPTTLVLRTSGATAARLVNGTSASVRIQALDEVVNDPAWKPIELVGLPVEQPWTGTAYDSREQGPLSAPRSPGDAAVDRLKRGAPPLGWPGITQGGRQAPLWVDADPDAVVKEVRRDLLPEIAQMYAASVPEYRQYLIENQRVVDGPQQDGRTSSLATTATIRPWSMLALPAQTDPLLNLATGFGATYFRESADRPELGVGNSDFLVTAGFARPPAPVKAKSTLAAYAPQVGPHLTTPPPTNLTAERSGLVAPVPVDTPWRESIRLSWDRLPTTASLGRVGAGSLARYDAGAAQAQSLAPTRDGGGWRPLTLSADGPPDTPGHARIAFVDAAADIPILSGGRQVGYAVSLVDIHGLWSPWRDVSYVGTEPGPLSPRLISLALDATYAGSASCPATLRLEIALDWTERTPTALDVVALYFPMASADAPPPVGLDPTLATPAGCFRRDLGLTFAGDVPTGVGATVTSLAPDGEQPMAPGPGQGNGGRRYRLAADLPTLDFSATQRWGVRIWVRSRLTVGASPTAYLPDALHPAIAVAASPVPVTPLPPPAPPGVPLGSTPDAQGCSHVRVHWSLPSGAAVRSCIVWEVAETSLRQRAGLPSRAPESDSPGVRLAALWSAYDGLSETAQRAAFRRVMEVDGTTRSVDVTLPKGSTDIHLFTVTTQSMTGIESPWPGPAASGHVHLQAVTAPRLRRPAPPLVRAVPGAAGSVSMTLYAASTVPVERFLVYATRSEAAARDRESMGPAIATVAAEAAPVGVDPVMSSPIYRGTWSGTLTPSWDPWLVRAIAQPVDTVPVQAIRGLPSNDSEITSLVVLPDGAPDLEPLTAMTWGPDNRGVFVHSSTNAPARATSSGSHRLSALAGATLVPLAALESLPETALASAPPGATVAPVLERGARATGRSPLGLWFTRPVAADPVDVTLRLVDPTGRATERTLTVPGFVPPPTYSIAIATTLVRATGVLLGVNTDAPATAAAGVVMRVRAVKKVVLGTILDNRLDATFALADIGFGKSVFPDDGQIHVVATRQVGLPRPPRYAVWVPLLPTVAIEVRLLAPDGGSVVTSVRV